MVTFDTAMHSAANYRIVYWTTMNYSGWLEVDAKEEPLSTSVELSDVLMDHSNDIIVEGVPAYNSRGHCIRYSYQT